MRRWTLPRLRNNSGNSWNSFINWCLNRFAMNSMHGVEAIYSSIRRILVLTPVCQLTHSSCSMTQARPTFNVSLTYPLYSDNLRNMPALSPCQSSPIVCLKPQCSGVSLLIMKNHCFSASLLYPYLSKPPASKRRCLIGS
jgi:hypothetical protein